MTERKAAPKRKQKANKEGEPRNRRADGSRTGSGARKPKSTVKSKSVKPTGAAKTKPKKAENNRPQGSAEGKRKRQQAKRKRRFDLVVADLKERSSVAELASLTRWSSGLMGSGWHNSKITSSLIFLLTVGTLFLIFTEPRCFVYADNVSFQNLNYLYPEEIYPELGIDGWSVFWIDPEEVKAAVLAHSYVADAEVSVSFPSHINIAIKEEQPTALWVTDAGPYWVLDDGSALPVRTTVTGRLLQILDGKQDAALADATESYLVNTDAIRVASLETSEREPTVIGAENLAILNGDAVDEAAAEITSIDERILASALRLAERYPGLQQITYSRGYGLNFSLPQRSEWIYWGDGNHFSQKLENMAAIHLAIAKSESSASLIDLRSPEKPYFR